MSLIVSLIARKGGSSKTTTVLNLAGAALDDDAGTVLVTPKPGRSVDDVLAAAKLERKRGAA